MKKYMKPLMEGQMFVSNEFVSACWGVACDTDAANLIEENMNNHPYGGHRASECGRFDQQAILTDSNNVATGMVELETYWGTLDCTIYTDNTYSQAADSKFISNIKSGQPIYWITSFGNNVYHHVGTVQYTDANRVNASV